MMKYWNTTSAYSVIIALFVMSFLLVLTTGMFRLVLWELIQNRWEEWYTQAFAGAESARELALLHIKQNWYGAYDVINHEISNRSILLSPSSDISSFKAQKEVFISYDLWYKANTYTSTVEKFGYDIIPLFSDDVHVKDITLGITQWNSETLLWNIIAPESGLAGFWEFTGLTPGKSRSLVSGAISFDTPSITEFLNKDDQNYLIIFNAGQSDLVYEVSTQNETYFTLPRTNIISSAQIWSYRQNLQTHLDNTQFLWILRYSIFSPNITN